MFGRQPSTVTRLRLRPTELPLSSPPWQPRGAASGCAKEHQQIRKVTIVCACASGWPGLGCRAPVQYGENRRQPDPLPNQHQRPISKNKDPQNSKQYSLKAGELFQIAFKMLTFVCSSFQLFADRSLSCLIDMAGCEDAKTHVDFLSSNQPS